MFPPFVIFLFLVFSFMFSLALILLQLIFQRDLRSLKHFPLSMVLIFSICHSLPHTDPCGNIKDWRMRPWFHSYFYYFKFIFLCNCIYLSVISRFYFSQCLFIDTDVLCIYSLHHGVSNWWFSTSKCIVAFIPMWIKIIGDLSNGIHPLQPLFHFSCFLFILIYAFAV